MTFANFAVKRFLTIAGDREPKGLAAKIAKTSRTMLRKAELHTVVYVRGIELTVYTFVLAERFRLAAKARNTGIPARITSSP